MTCTPSEDSDKLSHSHCLISRHCPPEKAVDPSLPIKRTAKTLIRLDGCTDHFVCFVMLRLKSSINFNKKRYDTQCHINRLDLDSLMFLISNCLTVIEVLVNFSTEPGPACWEVCHCEG